MRREGKNLGNKGLKARKKITQSADATNAIRK